MRSIELAETNIKPLKNDLVSVVVTTKNEEANLATCLESLRLQSWPHLEILVVDNGSTDATPSIARRYTGLVFDKGPERSAQRNFGLLEAAQGEFAMFVDADMVASPILVASCVAALRADPASVALHVGEVVLGASWWSRVRRFERDFYDGTVVDGARFFRRGALLSVGGFDASIWAGEDWDLDKRLKRLGSIRTLDRNPVESTTSWPLEPFIQERGVAPRPLRPVLYHNESGFRLGRYLAKKKYYAGSLDDYAAKWGRNDRDVARQLSPVYRLWTVFVEGGRWRRLLRHPLLAAGMYLLRVLVGFAWITRPRKNPPIAETPSNRG
ncbi:MAG: glycosyltransferase [Spirochaetes bacterium]|nr:glycosyltransferase [Spirochaetota bacterium]